MPADKKYFQVKDIEKSVKNKLAWKREPYKFNRGNKKYQREKGYPDMDREIQKFLDRIKPI